MHHVAFGPRRPRTLTRPVDRADRPADRAAGPPPRPRRGRHLARVRALARRAPAADRGDRGRAPEPTLPRARRRPTAPPPPRRREGSLTPGMAEGTYAAIGEIPQGRGILGVVMRETKPLRLHDISD